MTQLCRFIIPIQSTNIKPLFMISVSIRNRYRKTCYSIVDMIGHGLLVISSSQTRSLPVCQFEI